MALSIFQGGLIRYIYFKYDQIPSIDIEDQVYINRLVAISQDPVQAGLNPTRPTSGFRAQGFKPAELPIDPKNSNSKNPM